MSAPGTEHTLEERLASLESRVGDALAACERRTAVLEDRMSRMEWKLPRSARPAPAGATAVADLPRLWGPDGPPNPRARLGAAESTGAVPETPPTTGGIRRDAGQGAQTSLSDLVGGRLLAWIGGVATLVGIVLFLALAISHGWIGEQARVLLSGAASIALVAAGVWLHAHRGRTEAAIVMVGTGTAGLFATLIVAGEVYRLIPGLISVGASMVVGAVATALATRWAGRAIGALGLGGALLSPMLVGAPASTATIAVLAVAAACAMWVVAWQQWERLGLATVLLCAPQWALWASRGQPAALVIVVLIAFAGLGLAGGVGADLRSVAPRRHRTSIAILVLNACVVAVVGYSAVRYAAGAVIADLWLVGLGGAHATVGLSRYRLEISREVRQVLVTLAVLLADVAFGLSADGIALAIGWGTSAVVFAWLARRVSRTASDRTVMELGLGGHVALVLIRALIDAPPSTLGTGTAALVSLLSVSALAATCLVCARLTDPNRPAWQGMLDGLGFLAIAYLTAGVLDGAALVAAWALEGLALTRIARHTGEENAKLGGVAFLGGATLHALALEAPPVALLTGARDLADGAIALATLSGAALLGARTQPVAGMMRRWLLATAAVTLLYLASIAIVSAFQPTSAGAIDTVLDLGVRQQGQVLLSALWSVVGLAALGLGLRRSISAIRSGALALLLVTVAKVFLYDLSTLNSVYRVISFLVLGVLLLSGAFLYQRQRPPQLPDLRSVRPR